MRIESNRIEMCLCSTTHTHARARARFVPVAESRHHKRNALFRYVYSQAVWSRVARRELGSHLDWRVTRTTVWRQQKTCSWSPGRQTSDTIWQQIHSWSAETRRGFGRTLLGPSLMVRWGRWWRWHVPTDECSFAILRQFTWQYFLYLWQYSWKFRSCDELINKTDTKCNVVLFCCLCHFYLRNFLNWH